VSGTLTRRKRQLFALAAIATTFAAALGSLLAVDVYLHGKYERSAGFNLWGYRGPVAHRKRPGEFRVVVLGGSSAYGYGVEWADAFPAVLEHTLAARNRAAGRSFSVVNLGYNNEGAYSFKPTLKDYEYLGYDLVCLYEGYNDLMADPAHPNVAVFRHDSPIFRLTGYLPIFPIVFHEKAAALTSGGDVSSLYPVGAKTTFKPSLAARTTAEALRATADVTRSLERQLGRVVAEPPRRIDDLASTGCHYPWQQYCRSVLVAIDYALARDKQVLVVTQPYAIGKIVADKHRDQQHELASMLARKFGGDSRVHYINLGTAVDLTDPVWSFDGMHLTPAGNEKIADALVAPVMAIAAGRQTRQS